jgi:hypothetical protein
MDTKTITHDQSNPKYGFVIFSVILTFVGLLAIVYFSTFYYAITISEDQTIKDAQYQSRYYNDFKEKEQIELDRLENESSYVKLPIDIAKKAVLLNYNR